MKIEDYARLIQGWTDALLERYLVSLRRRASGSVAVKEFNDPLWGTIAIRAEEVVVLDSPLLQRLRRIRQLGVVHLVYASANHTRFEHSIGVCHQVGRMAGSLRDHADEPLMDDEQMSLLRMTGLCHDIGHGCLSHVIENALTNDRSTRALLAAFTEQYGLESKPHLSEVAAHFMLLSEGFDDLVTQAFRLAGANKPEGLASDMSKIVIGQKVSDEFPLLHELISGPFDADKLDYMPRDAMMTGVPVVTDIGRLIQKVRGVRLPADELPERLKAQVTPLPQEHLIVGLAQSGGSTLDEVAIGRSLMFDKVYRHHKVRAAEAMVTAIVDVLGPDIEPHLPLLPLRIYDEDILSLDESTYSKIVPTHVLAEGLSNEVVVGLELGRRLSDRELFVRAFAFSQHLPEDPYRGDDARRLALDSLFRQANKADTRQELVTEIAQMVREMCERTQRILDPTLASNISRFIWIDPPASQHPDTKPDPSRAYVIGSDGKAREVKTFNAEQRGWVDAYTNTHDIGYVFTVSEIADMVAVATQMVLFKRFRLQVPRTWSLHTKLSIDSLEQLQRTLLSTGFYKDKPPSLRPLSDRMRRADIKGRVTQVVDRLSRIQSPSSDPTELKDATMSSERVLDWIRQFGTEHEEDALLILEGFLVLGRQETNRYLRAFLDSEVGRTFRGAAVVPLGQPKDGSAVLAYHAEDVVRHFEGHVLALEDAIESGLPILFVDDFIGRGSSTISILNAELGLPDTQKLHERRPARLPEDKIEVLLRQPVAFRYTAGLEEGVRNLHDELRSMGFEDVRAIQTGIPEVELPTLHTVLSKAGKSEQAVEQFRARAREIGRRLLMAKTEAADARALGYGNRELLVATSYNTPSATLTAVWEQGTVDDWPWFALLPRRKKL